MKKIAIILALIMPLSLFAQNENDALRYSQNFFSGTARYNSMGGAFGALGGDFSVACTNPASLGVFRKSEFTFTPGFQYNHSSASFLDGTLDDYKFRMNISNLGFVATHNSGREEGWVTTSFAVGYNRLNDFNNYVKIEGQNDESSMTEYFAKLANGKTSDNLNFFSEGLAWDTYLIDPDSNGVNQYITALTKAGAIQKKDINTKGGMGEYLFALAGNYSNKLYLGGSIGIQSVRYLETTEYVEDDMMDSIPDFNWFKYNTYLRTTGAGFNFKFGMAFRPADWIRIGAAVHTPTFYSLHDEYNSSMQSNFNSPDSVRGDGRVVESELGSYDYELVTPFRAIGSLGIIVGKIALVGVEYEFVDYTTARLRADDYSFRNENNAVETAYQATGNLRAGVEIRTGPFSTRFGYFMYGSPFRPGLPNSDAVRTGFSAGFGMKDEDFYFDIGATYVSYSEKYYIYDPSIVSVPATTIKNTNVALTTTFGFKF